MMADTTEDADVTNLPLLTSTAPDITSGVSTDSAETSLTPAGRKETGRDNPEVALSIRGKRVSRQESSRTNVSAGRTSVWNMSIDIFTEQKKTIDKSMSKRARSFYKCQNELIEAYEGITTQEAIAIGQGDSVASGAEAILYSKITLLVNVILLVGKAVASSLSGSIAIISSLVDTCLDLLSGAIMWWATRAVQKRDIYHYPQGRTKQEPVAIIILSVVMALASVQLVIESIQTIINLARADGSLPLMDAIPIIIAGATVVIKLVLWLVCRRKKSPVIQALAQDHRNDVLSNLVAIVCGYIGSKNFVDITETYGCAYVDPIGAMLISLYILYNWWQTGREHMKMVIGHTAEPDFLSKLTWLTLNHHAEIVEIDTVRAFHFGSNFLVEVDIVLPRHMHLVHAHDIGQSLQSRLESMPEVERAFVHLDFESTHDPQSEHKVV